MICKQCGTEYTGSYCVHCAEREQRGAAQPKRQRVGRRMQDRKGHTRLSLPMVIRDACLFFLPLFYIFSEVFVAYSPGLYGEAGGGNLLSLLIERLADAGLASNPTSDIFSATYETGVLYETVSLAELSTRIDFVPALTVIAILALLGAAAGSLLLVTGGRILYRRLFADLIVFAGGAGALSPLVGMLVLRLSYLPHGGFVEADREALFVGFTVEAYLGAAVLLCLTLFSVRSVALLAARVHGEESGHLWVFFKLLPTKRYNVLRWGAFVLSLFAVLLGALTALSPVLSIGNAFRARFDFSEVLGHLGNDIASCFSQGETAPDVLSRLGFALQCLVCAVTLLSALLLCWRLMLAKKNTLSRQRRADALMRGGRTLRASTFAFFGISIATQLAIACCLLFNTGMTARLDVSSVEGVLSLVYPVLSYARSLVPITSASLLTGVGSLLLAGVVGGISRRLVEISRSEQVREHL
ncbi:MAG: hypothetical protein E7663_00020 [Ruminococcaceae bacterium]|nr:hypothetical protein [Oscillospiraceae bacterium]